MLLYKLNIFDQMHAQLKTQTGKIWQKTKTEIIFDLTHFSTLKKDSYDCLLVLNLKLDQQMLDIAVQCASNIILADGGANQFYYTAHRDSSKVKAIVGDLDSLKPQIQQYYKHRNVQICRIEDQDHNDFQKSVNKALEEGFRTIVCLGAIGGRLDHTLGAMHLLTKYGRQCPELQIFLIGDNNFMLYLRPKHKYRLRVGQTVEKKGVGLLPFKKAENITTTGFKWNLGGAQGLTTLEWGSFISTSNQITGEQVTVSASDELYFVFSLKQKE